MKKEKEQAISLDKHGGSLIHPHTTASRYSKPLTSNVTGKANDLDDSYVQS